MSILIDTEIVEMQCGECGIFFWITDGFHQERKQTGKNWYCPNGHSRVYRKSDVDLLKEQLQEANRKLSSTQFELLETEKKVSRLEKRARGGICPCCNRQFVGLARHMKTKHPDFGT